MKMQIALCVFLLAAQGLLCSSPIVSLRADHIETAYTYEAGVGMLTLSDTGVLAVTYSDGLTAERPDVQFQLSTPLMAVFASTCGCRVGVFAGGIFSIAAGGEILLSGSIVELEAATQDACTRLAAFGVLAMESGVLLSDMNLGRTTTVSWSFTSILGEGTVCDFFSDFTALSDAVFYAVPEPATLLPVGLGGLALRRKRRRRH